MGSIVVVFDSYGVRGNGWIEWWLMVLGCWIMIVLDMGYVSIDYM